MSKRKATVSLTDVAGRDRPTTGPGPGRAQGRKGGPVSTGATRDERKAPARGSQVQVGLYVSEATMEEARAAYLSDYLLRGEAAPNGFDHWIGEAVRHLAALTPTQRQRRLDGLPEEGGTVVDRETGQTRPAERKPGKVRLSEDTASRMDIAREADEREGRAYRGRTTFIVAAMRAGVDRARDLRVERLGDSELPPAPTRLPRRSSSRI